MTHSLTILCVLILALPWVRVFWPVEGWQDESGWHEGKGVVQ